MIIAYYVAFVNMGMSNPTPDHSTLSLFRSRIEAAEEPAGPESKEKRRERIEEQYRYIFDQILQEATRLGIEWGPIRAADSVHTVATTKRTGSARSGDSLRQTRMPA